jgi:diaminohydroxyphosphoribosylaminopyrimidine deaminase/5-amino-6-(5-phosphoribosylamino)uracil reductase
LRSRVDAIVVGSNTVRRDDPLLTARGVPRLRPAFRVVMDARLRVSEDCQLFKTIDAGRVLVFTSRDRTETTKAKRLRSRGAEVLACRSGTRGLAIADVLKALARRDCTNVLVEGGPTLVGRFLDAELIDEANVFISAMSAGDRLAPALVLARPPRKIRDARAPAIIEVRRYERDVYLRLRLNDLPWPERLPDSTRRAGRARTRRS